MTPISRWWLVLGLSLALQACNQGTNFRPAFDQLKDPDRAPETIRQNPLETFCSKLDFSKLSFPQQMTKQDVVALALSLNITGSIEGNGGWQTISNNFDDTGMSLGLLNQNLGSGSLQPLLIRMQQEFEPDFNGSFAPQRLSSIAGMLVSWQSSGPTNIETLSHGRLSILDMDFDVSIQGVRDDKSVQWAIDNLYQSNGNFKPEWKRELTELAGKAPYRQIQLDTAGRYFQKARRHHQNLNFSELRSYLFFFDIVIQNGDFYSDDLTDYRSWIRSNGQASEKAKLEKLLQLRLRHVKPQWRENVRIRKQAIIDGKGTVNQTRRQFEKEYCYDGMTPY